MGCEISIRWIDEIIRNTTYSKLLRPNYITRKAFIFWLADFLVVSTELPKNKQNKLRKLWYYIDFKVIIYKLLRMTK